MSRRGTSAGPRAAGHAGALSQPAVAEIRRDDPRSEWCASHTPGIGPGVAGALSQPAVAEIRRDDPRSEWCASHTPGIGPGVTGAT